MRVARLLLFTLIIHSLTWLSVGAARAEAPCESAPRMAEGEMDACAEPLSVDSARGVGLGTGSRAASMSTSALAYNPAALVLGRIYHVEAQVDHMSSRATALGGTVVDSHTSQLSAGFGIRGFFSGQDGYKGFDGRLALAFPFSDMISLGVTGRYLDAYREVDGGGDERVRLDMAKGFTMDASFRIMPTGGLHLAVLAQNFIDLESPYVPVMVGGAVGFEAGGSFILGVDVLTDVSTFETPQLLAGGGIEFLASQSFPLRAGYRFDAGRSTHAVSGGMGYTDRHVGVDFSVAKEVSGDDELRIDAAFRYYIQ